MTSILRWSSGLLQQVDNRVNPIVIRELRQAVAGRLFHLTLLLLLGLQYLVLTFSVLLTPMVSAEDVGLQVFGWLSAVLLGVCLLFVPTAAALRLAWERGENTDLVYVSTLAPRRIAWGKFFASLVMVAMIFMVCLPFLSLTYLLGGIDLLTILIVLLVDFLVIAMYLMLGITLGALPGSRIIRAMAMMGGLVLMLIGYVWINVIKFDVLMIGFLSAGAELVSLLVALAAGVALIGFLGTLATSMLSPPPVNRALPVRIYFTLLWGISLAAVLVATRVGGADTMWMVVWLVAATVSLCAVMVGTVCERERAGMRILHSVPRSSPGRGLAFMFSSGVYGGLAWVLLLAAGTIATAYWLRYWDLPFFTIDGAHVWSHNLVVVLLYALAYSATGLAIYQALFSHTMPRSMVWIIVGVLFGVGHFPPLVYAFADMRTDPELYPVVYLFAVSGWMFVDRSPVPLSFGAGWAVLAMLIQVPGMRGAFRAFRRPSLPAVALEKPAPAALDGHEPAVAAQEN